MLIDPNTDDSMPVEELLTTFGKSDDSKSTQEEKCKGISISEDSYLDKHGNIHSGKVWFN